MKSNLMMAGAACALATVLTGPAHAAMNLIVNGDFSTPNTGTGWAESGAAGWAPGWANDNGDMVEIGYSPIYGLGCATANCHNLEVNANTFDSVSQTITGLTPGSSYNLSYLYGGRTQGGLQMLDVSFGGVHLTTNTGSYGVWSLNNFTVVANASTQTLTFASQTIPGSWPSYGNEITSVSLTAVPEPTGWILMLTGFGALGAMLRRRRSQATLAA